jgi:hypothetical protein
MTSIDKYKIYFSPVSGIFPVQFLSMDELETSIDLEMKTSDYIEDLIPDDGFYQIFDKNKLDTNQFEELAVNLIASYNETDDPLEKIVLLSKLHDVFPEKKYLYDLKNELIKYQDDEYADYYLSLIEKELKPIYKKSQQTIQEPTQSDKILLFSQGSKALRLSSIKEYMLQNRKAFALFMRQTFQPEVNKLPFNPIRMWDPVSNQFVEKIPFAQQKFVSYYLSEYTPYRGLLLYHGLGSGKTGSSIMIAEGFRNRRVVVLLPASLHTNYENEIRTFGEIAYKRQFNWKFIRIPIDSSTGRPYNYVYDELENKGIARDLLGTILIKYGENYGIFMINYSATEPNYDNFPLTDKHKIDTQINKMLEWKYSILHYNAGSYTIPYILQKCLSKTHYSKILKDLFNTESKTTFSKGTISQMLDYIFNPKNNVPNPFDDKVVIIDEVHNITSHLIGNGYVAIFLYELIMRAKNCKLVFLSGTPIINSSFELALLFNMLNGFTYEYTIPLSKRGGLVTTDELTQLLNNSKYVDRYTIDTLKGFIKIILVPREFENSYIDNRYMGIKKSFIDITNEEMLADVIQTLSLKGYEINDAFIKETLYTPFPDILNHDVAIAIQNKTAKPVKMTTKKEFNYLMGSNKRLRLLNDLEFRTKRVGSDRDIEFKNKIQGFVSFYNEIAGVDEKTGYNLFPTKIDASPEETEVLMSDYQYIEYCRRATIEFQIEENAKLQKFILEARAYKGDIVDFGEVPTTFRVYTRQAGIFVFPPQIERPTRILSKKIMKLTYEQVYKMVKSLISINNIEERYNKLNNMLNRFKLTSNKAEYNNDVTLLSVLRDIYPNHTLPGNKLELFKNNINNETPVLRDDIKIDIENIDDEVDTEHNDDIINDTINKDGTVITDDKCNEEYGECSLDAITQEADYDKAIVEAMNKLLAGNLMPASAQEDNGASVNYITLEMLSPKYTKILENINNTQGLVMCYSQYRSVEGIELLTRVLNANGYISYTNQPEAVVLKKGMRVRYEYEKDKWQTSMITHKVRIQSTSQIEYRLDGNPNKRFKRAELYPCQYSLWTGTENVEQRKTVLNTFNTVDNRFGQKCLIIMITQSGAEGISLFNVRQVHILEPYWNNIRVRQVVGRARRIRSHINLPIDQQNVKVFNYILKFNSHQKQYSQEQSSQTDYTGWLKRLIELVGFDNIKPLLFRLYDINEYSDAIITDINEKSQEAVKNDKFLTADEILSSASHNKDLVIDSFSKLMKEAAVDCDFNKEDNIKSDPSLANLSCYQDITDIQTRPFIYNYNDIYSQNNLPKEIESIPQSQPINIDFIYKSPIDKTKYINLAVKSQIMSNQTIPSSLKDKLAFIKSGMNIYKYDTTLKKITDENIPIGLTEEITKADGSKGITVRFTPTYKSSLK